MSGTRWFVDTAVLIFAVGDEHAQREPCRTLVQAAVDGVVDLHASVEAVQEFAFHRLRRGSRDLAVRQGETMRDLLVLHTFDTAIVDRMLHLVATSSVGGRDAVHASTALEEGFGSIVSPDRGFDHVPGLTRVEPVDAAP